MKKCKRKRQKKADQGVGDKNPKEDDWKAFQKVQPKFYLDKDLDVFGDWVCDGKKVEQNRALSARECSEAQRGFLASWKIGCSEY